MPPASFPIHEITTKINRDKNSFQAASMVQKEHPRIPFGLALLPHRRNRVSKVSLGWRAERKETLLSGNHNAIVQQ